MTKKFPEEFYNLLNELDWNIDEYVWITLSKYSPAGQDFNIEIDKPDDIYDVLSEIKDRCENYDCSEEAYLWLDDFGHGKNGAPYDMKDVYEDMEACLKMMEELRDRLEDLIDELEDV